MNSWWDFGLQSNCINCFKSLPQLDLGLSVMYLRMIAFWWNRHIWIGIFPSNFLMLLMVTSSAINCNAANAVISGFESVYSFTKIFNRFGFNLFEIDHFLTNLKKTKKPYSRPKKVVSINRFIDLEESSKESSCKPSEASSLSNSLINFG